MTLAAYTGHEALTFTDYLDLETGKTLHAVPGEGPYDIAPVSGRQLLEVPEPWFTRLPFAAVSYDARMLAQELAAGEDAVPEAEAEPAPEPAPDEAPDA